MTRPLSSIPRVAWYRRWLARPWLLARRPFLRRRLARADRVRVRGLDLVVSPGVHHPVVFRSGAWLAEVLDTVPLDDLAPHAKRVLDVGCGTGIQSLVLARRGCRVTALDVHAAAVRCARDNVRRNRLETLVRCVQGDLFEAFREGAFDLVVCNPPFFAGSPTDAADRAWRSPDLPARLADGLGSAVTPGGSAVFVLSTDGVPDRFLDALAAAGWNAVPLARRDFGNEIMTVYRAGRG